MVDPLILTTPVLILIKEDFKSALNYICDICWKFQFQRSVIKLKKPKYQTDIYNEYTKSDWICKSCHDSSK